MPRHKIRHWQHKFKIRQEKARESKYTRHTTQKTIIRQEQDEAITRQKQEQEQEQEQEHEQEQEQEQEQDTTRQNKARQDTIG